MSSAMTFATSSSGADSVSRIGPSAAFGRRPPKRDRGGLGVVRELLREGLGLGGRQLPIGVARHDRYRLRAADAATALRTSASRSMERATARRIEGSATFARRIHWSPSLAWITCTPSIACRVVTSFGANPAAMSTSPPSRAFELRGVRVGPEDDLVEDRTARTVDHAHAHFVVGL